MARAIPIHRPSVGDRELEAVRRVLDSRWLGSGPVTEQFEAGIREVTGAAHAVAVSSGSAALHVALVAAGTDGHEVVLPSLAHLSAPQAVLAAGGTPVFCDVELETGNLDPDRAAALVGPRTRALLPVHYAGFACRMDDVLELARRHDLVVVEDGAHAFGSTHGGRPVGSLGDLTCFSFDAVKNVTCGEGGAVTTNDADLAGSVRRVANHGVENGSWGRRDDSRPWAYAAEGPGFRYQLSDVNAALGLAQLEGLGERRERKRALLRRYRDGFAGIDGVIPVGGDVESAFPLLCVVRVTGGRRDEVAAHLAEEGIQAWMHFVPCHRQPAFADGRAAGLPVTEQLEQELLTLPLHPGLTDDDVDRVTASMGELLGS